MHFYKWLGRRLHFQGLRSLKMRILLVVNDKFSFEHNAENGVFLQPLNRGFYFEYFNNKKVLQSQLHDNESACGLTKE